MRIEQPFLLLPAIDLKDGRAVRLRQGSAHAETRYSEDPVKVARQFAEAGARALHIVDLDGAFSGAPVHLALVARICRASALPVRFGGGLRETRDIEAAFSAGVHVAILGTAAIEEPERLAHSISRFGQRLAVSLDVKDGAVLTRGWVESATLSLEAAAARIAEAGVGDLIVTDVARDGELSGPDIPLFRRAAEAFGSSVIAAGGIADEKDLMALEAEPAVRGAVVGKAFYEGTLSLAVFRKGAL
jgi:phosphoribosylformimino-5-aminoimidazole carboxamide ribotide isomerase